MQLKTEVQQLHAGMIRWCRAHYGEAFSAWIHVKLVKSFVESVMRYGLPVDFTTVFLAPKKGMEGKVSVGSGGRGQEAEGGAVFLPLRWWVMRSLWLTLVPLMLGGHRARQILRYVLWGTTDPR